MSDSNNQASATNLNNLVGQLLISMPCLNESFFSHTITLICNHSNEGAMGLVLNHSLGVPLVDIFDQLDITNKKPSNSKAPIMSGGPVQQDRGFVLHSAGPTWDSTIPITDDISLTVSQDVIQAIANGQSPEKFIVTLGYAGWDKNQLEDEIADNAWLILPADSSIVFDSAIEERWNIASQRLGIDLNLISSTAGHA
jgi:putative transcriptional regulator